MKTELTSVTVPVLLTGDPEAPLAAPETISPEDLIVEQARVSSSREDKLHNAMPLVRHLITNHHWSPFEMVSACFMIQTSRAIAAQILRHRSFSFQEFSQRYAKATEFEPITPRYQATKNRQSSTNELTSGGDAEWANENIENALNACSDAYKELLDMGVAKECARMVLPLTTRTTLYMTGTLRSWIHYLQIRDEEHAQLEHQLIAKEIKATLGKVFPITWEALEWR